MIAAKGILTAHGGMTSHAAVVARGMGKPCVAGCEALSVDAAARTAALDGHELAEGDVITIDGGTGRVILGPVDLVPPQINEDFETILGWADEHAAPEGARERGHARGRGQGARVRRAGHRALPHRAHVHGRGPAPGRARDDHGLERGGAAPRARQAAPAPAGGLRGHLRGDGGPAGHDPAARPAAARVPAAARRGDGRQDARADPGAAGGEPDARHARLPPRPDVARDLRDAGARDRARRAGGAGAHRRRAARRDHAPARRLRRGAEAAAGDHDRDGRRGGRARVPASGR